MPTCHRCLRNANWILLLVLLTCFNCYIIGLNVRGAMKMEGDADHVAVMSDLHQSQMISGQRTAIMHRYLIWHQTQIIT